MSATEADVMKARALVDEAGQRHEFLPTLVVTIAEALVAEREKARDEVIAAAPTVHLLPDDVVVLQLPSEQMTPDMAERLHHLFAPRKVAVVSEHVRFGHTDAEFGAVNWTLP